MKEINIKLYDSLEDEFTVIENIENEKINSVGFSIQISDIVDRRKLINDWNLYLQEFKNLINTLIDAGKIKKIYFIGVMPYAITAPSVRYAFICHCNQYESNSLYEGREEGETLTFVNLKEIRKFIEELTPSFSFSGKIDIEGVRENYLNNFNKLTITNFIFNNREELNKHCLDFFLKIRLVKQNKGRLDGIVKSGSIGFVGKEGEFSFDVKFLGKKIYVQVCDFYNQHFIGKHPDVWVIKDFYGIFTKHLKADYLNKVEEKFYAELLPSLASNGHIFTFSLKEDYEALLKIKNIFNLYGSEKYILNNPIEYREIDINFNIPIN